MIATGAEHRYFNVTRSQSRRMAGKLGILIVDDMALNLALLEAELEPCGYAIWLAQNANDAIDSYRQYHDEIDVVLLDVQMPGLDGPLTLAAMQSYDANLQACFLTDDTNKYTVDDLLDRGALRVFCKPLRPSEVLCFIQQLLGGSDPAGYVCDWSSAEDCKTSSRAVRKTTASSRDPVW
jgi:CheY-like chemotaxis protein